MLSLILQQTKDGHEVTRHHQLAFALGWTYGHLVVSPKPGSERANWSHQILWAPNPWKLKLVLTTKASHWSGGLFGQPTQGWTWRHRWLWWCCRPTPASPQRTPSIMPPSRGGIAPVDLSPHLLFRGRPRRHLSCTASPKRRHYFYAQKKFCEFFNICHIRQ